MLDKTKIVFLVVFIQLNFVVGWSQENQRSIKNTIMERPIITSEFENLDLSKYKDGLTKKKETSGHYKGNEFDSYSFEKIDQQGETLFRGSSIGGFSYNFTPKNSLYMIGKSYYINNFKEGKCILSSVSKSLIIGKEYFFDKEGKLERTIDHDIGWDFSYEKIIQYILDRKASLFGGNSLLPANISKQGTSRKYWELKLDTTPITKTESWEIIKLDAMTGEVLYQIESRGTRVWMGDITPPAPEQKIIVADKTIEKK